MEGPRRSTAGPPLIYGACGRCVRAHGLAADDRLSRVDVDAINARLRRWDDAAESPWTRQHLEMIANNEAVRAPDLAARVGLDTPRFKRRVRQLKGLGLTISLDVGYRISPRGRAYLARGGTIER